MLEELAATFQLKTQDAIDRLQKLVEEGELTGKNDTISLYLVMISMKIDFTCSFLVCWLIRQKKFFKQGVIDDRGKFIYISREEMEAVAKFIRQRGRISLSDLAESSNQLIQLAPENSTSQKSL